MYFLKHKGKPKLVCPKCVKMSPSNTPNCAACRKNLNMLSFPIWTATTEQIKCIMWKEAGRADGKSQLETYRKGVAGVRSAQ